MTLAASLDALLARSWASAGATTTSSWPEENRLSGTEIATLLRAHKYALLATTRKDGRAHQAPVSYAVADDASIWLPTAAGAVRLKHVAARPWAAFAVMHGEGDDEHVAVLAEGDVRTVSLDDARAADLGTTLRDEPWIHVWLVLTPARVLAYGPASRT